MTAGPFCVRGLQLPGAADAAALRRLDRGRGGVYGEETFMWSCYGVDGRQALEEPLYRRWLVERLFLHA